MRRGFLLAAWVPALTVALLVGVLIATGLPWTNAAAVGGLGALFMLSAQSAGFRWRR